MRGLTKRPSVALTSAGSFAINHNAPTNTAVMPATMTRLMVRSSSGTAGNATNSTATPKSTAIATDRL
jgi:hypothetical protein